MARAIDEMFRLRIARYDSALLDLKRKNQRVDWDGVTDMDSEGVSRRIARYSSEVK